MDVDINLDLENLIAALPDDTKNAIRAAGGLACLVSDNFTINLSLKVNDNCTLRGVWEKVPVLQLIEVTKLQRTDP